jgi:hypothetical protein
MVLPFLLALGAVLGVGAAAYSRGVTGSGSAHPSGPVPVAANPAAPVTQAAPAGSANPGAAALPRTPDNHTLKVEIGQLSTTTDYSGVTQTSLPVTVTNTGPLTHSFDVTIVGLDKTGQKITADTGTAANLRPGQSAQLRVLEIVNDTLVRELATASFQVQSVFTY